MKNKKIPLLPKSFKLEMFFDVKKYERTEPMGAAEWASHLMFRRMMEPYFDGRKQTRVENGERLPFNPWALLDEIWKRPYGKARQFGPMLAKPGFAGVSDMRVYDLWTERKTMERIPEIDAACRKADALWSEDVPDPDSEPEVCREGYSGYLLRTDQSRYKADETFARVDLGLPDEMLVSDFKGWLALKRLEMKEHGRRTPPKGEFGDADFAEWQKKRALAYIDLELFCSLAGHRLTDKQFANLLFPEEFDVDTTERVRKVVRPCASFLMDYTTIEVLDAQAAREAERKS